VKKIVGMAQAGHVSRLLHATIYLQNFYPGCLQDYLNQLSLASKEAFSSIFARPPGQE
jgi:hypothetical protein